LSREEVEPKRKQLVKDLFKLIPVGVGTESIIHVSMPELNDLLKRGLEWAVDKGYAWPEDIEHCEENGRMKNANPADVSDRAKARGVVQLGTLGAGNHYAEVQVVEEVFDEAAAKAMGLKKDQVVIFLHTGSRGLGHQVATDMLQLMEKAMARDKITLNDRQLACARISSEEGKKYLRAMSAAANFAWCNRSVITHHIRKVFSELFNKSARELDMHLVYDVSHNMAKEEEHIVDGQKKRLLVHRKGSTRAFPPHHPLIPKSYQEIGQPVLIGGTMSTYSYVLVGTEKGMKESYGSTCHGAGRVMSRHKARGALNSNEILQSMEQHGISIKVGSKRLVMEEAAESYKDVVAVVETCEKAGISKAVTRMKPLAVIKG
jgi:tRNA-splicing ligase RtcB